MRCDVRRVWPNKEETQTQTICMVLGPSRVIPRRSEARQAAIGMDGMGIIPSPRMMRVRAEGRRFAMYLFFVGARPGRQVQQK